MNGYATILKALPGTIAELMHKTGYSNSQVKKYVTDMRANKEAHIVGWAGYGPAMSAIFSAGAGCDVDKDEAASTGNSNKCATVPNWSSKSVTKALSAQRRAFPLSGVWS